MTRVKMLIEYDGSRYHGFQRQNNAHTIQAEIEQQILRVSQETVTVSGAGRTDAGVHALGQVITFVSQSRIPADRWHLALNTLLPEDIRALRSEEADERFHPAFNAIRKHYRYCIYRQQAGALFYRRHALIYTNPLDVGEMQKACKFIEGYHDFQSFCSSGATTKTSDRTVYSCSIVEKGSELILDIEANGFLYNMVRIIVGTLIEVGVGRIRAEQLPEIISGCNRSLAGPTAPPQGLYLMRVDY